MVQNFFWHARAGMGIISDHTAFGRHCHNNCIVFQEKHHGRMVDIAVLALGRLCLDFKWRYLDNELIVWSMDDFSTNAKSQSLLSSRICPLSGVKYLPPTEDRRQRSVKIVCWQTSFEDGTWLSDILHSTSCVSINNKQL